MLSKCLNALTRGLTLSINAHIEIHTDKLPTAKRAKILTLLCEGMSMRAIARTEDVSQNTVAKALIEAGTVCAGMPDELVQGVKATRVQCDEIWSFNYCKQRTVATAKAAPEDAGDVWTWTAIDADSKLIVSYLVGDRSGQAAIELMDDLRSRLTYRVQLSTDGHRAYLEAEEGAFGGDVDYAQIISNTAPRLRQRGATALPNAPGSGSSPSRATRK